MPTERRTRKAAPAPLHGYSLAMRAEFHPAPTSTAVAPSCCATSSRDDETTCTGTSRESASTSNSSVIGMHVSPGLAPLAAQRSVCSANKQMEGGSSRVRCVLKASPSAQESDAIWWLRPIVRSFW